jgi:hypothetical protein
LPLAAFWSAASIPDHHVTIPDRLLGFGDGDSTGSKLVESDLRGKQLADDIRHQTSMTNIGDTTLAAGKAGGFRTTASN